MPELTFTALRTLVEVDRAGSFSAAAERLGYTQSAVSRQVALAEDVAGSPLFQRHARGVRLTPAGEVLARHARLVLDGLTAASQELAGLRDRVAGRLAVGAFPTANAVVVPRALALVRRRHPGLDVRLVESGTPAQVRALRAGRLEVAVLATGEGLPDLDLEGLALTPLRGVRGPGVAVAADHPLAGRASVGVDDLAGLTWVVGAGEGPQFGVWPGAADARTGFAVRDWPTRLGLVAAGLGVCVVPGIAADAVPAGVVWVPVRDRGADVGFRRSTSVATAADPGPAATALVEALVSVVSALR